MNTVIVYLRLRAVLVCGLLCLLTAFARPANWLPFGPFGGDARSLVADPKDHTHLFLGTANGWIYESRNGGQLWKRLAQLDRRNDLVLDHIVVDREDPKHLVVGVWVLGHADGGIYRSRDGGESWTENAEMKGQSVRSFAVAPSDPKIMIAGTLKGVFRSTDSGEHWAAISPEGSTEIHEIESVAIDPVNPAIVYAGTWHLPWKTVDGGEHWSNVKEGIIDDSDVFSILVDPADPKTIYASACSGIYKSQNSGEKFQKVQGIPSTARRTRVLKQDTKVLSTVFAGTTEGLFKTTNAGKDWTRTTGPELIVNDVLIDPENSNRVLLATDRGGVLASDDGGQSFRPANDGFSARQVASYATDARHPGTVYLGVLNDKEWGGVFVSEDGGLRWTQQASGLAGRDVFSLAQASDGTLLAGTGHGIFRLSGASWTESDTIEVTPEAKPPAAPVGHLRRRGTAALRSVPANTKPAARSKAVQATEKIDPAVYGLAVDGDAIYAAGSLGLLRSRTAGSTWMRVADVKEPQVLVAAAHSAVAVTTLHAIMRSSDSGESWSSLPVPPGLTQVTALAIDDRGTIWVGGREGLFYTADGSTWKTPEKLFVKDVNSISFDRAGKRMLITANQYTHLVFAIGLEDNSVKSWDTGWHLRFVQPVGDYLIGATLFDGVVVQPKMVDSPLAINSAVP